MSELVLDPSKSLEQNLLANGLPGLKGGRHSKKRGGVDATTSTEDEAADKAAKMLIAGVITSAWKTVKERGPDAMKKLATAAVQAGTGGAIVYLADQTFSPGLCSPLVRSMSVALSTIPSVAGYVANCDAAANAYNTAVVASTGVLIGLVAKALETTVSIVVEQSKIDAVKGFILKALRSPGSAISDAMASGEDDEFVPAAAPRARRGGKRKTVKKTRKVSKRRTARRFVY